MVTYRQIAKKEKIILVCYILGICYAKSMHAALDGAAAQRCFARAVRNGSRPLSGGNLLYHEMLHLVPALLANAWAAPSWTYCEWDAHSTTRRAG